MLQVIVYDVKEHAVQYCETISQKACSKKVKLNDGRQEDNIQMKFKEMLSIKPIKAHVPIGGTQHW